MKHIYYLLISLCFLFLTSCGDSPDKLMKDQISYTKEYTRIINDIADGKVSSKEGASLIEKWHKKGDEIKERKQKFFEERPEEELTKVAEKYGPEINDTTKEMFKAMDKLSKSGRLTKELSDMFGKTF